MSARPSESSRRASAVALSVLGAWSTAALLGELLLLPSLGVAGFVDAWQRAGLANTLLRSFALALMLGTPFAVVAYRGVAKCLRERRASLAAPLLLAAAWWPLFLFAGVAGVGKTWLPVVGAAASWASFVAAGWLIARSEHHWLARRTPRDTRTA